MEFIHFQGDENHPLYLLFHGTGGNETELPSLMELIDDKASYLSFRGDVNEHGLLRFFKRVRPGVFDEDDLIERTGRYQAELQDLLKTYQTKAKHVIALGYSNGANFIGSLLYHNESRIQTCVLLHPMVPYQSVKPKDLPGIRVFISAGTNDPICPFSEAETLQADLTNARATAELFTTLDGHQVSKAEIAAAKAWLWKTY